MAKLLQLCPVLLYALLLLSCSSVKSRDDVPLQETAQSEETRMETVVERDTCPAITAPRDAWYSHSVGYEIFVRSFYDSDGDGVGDFNGITQKLDYLNDGDPNTHTDLGIDLVWLMPTFKSPSYHGYDVTDYRSVNPDYGTPEDFKRMVEEAHKRGIRILLDLVLNHTSNQHPWFLASKGRDDPKRNWYVWSETPMTWPRPWDGSGSTWHDEAGAWYYGVFWEGMPDLNFKEPEVRQEMVDIARFWLDEYDVDGFRLDAVRYLVETGPGAGQQDTAETLDYWREFSTAVHKTHPDALLLGEAWVSDTVAAGYLANGKGLDAVFDFDFMESIGMGALAEEPADLEAALCRYPKLFAEGSVSGTFLTNHDLVRLASRLQEDEAAIRLAPLLLFTLPGLPFVYYGQEIGQRNGPKLTDEHKRLPMQWSAETAAGFTQSTPWESPNADYEVRNVDAMQADPDSLWHLYRRLVTLRKENSALLHGDFSTAEVTSKTASNLMAFVRRSESNQAVVVVNFSSTSALEARVVLEATKPADWRQVWPEDEGKVVEGSSQLQVGDVPPRSGVIFIAP